MLAVICDNNLTIYLRWAPGSAESVGCRQLVTLSPEHLVPALSDMCRVSSTPPQMWGVNEEIQTRCLYEVSDNLEKVFSEETKECEWMVQVPY